MTDLEEILASSILSRALLETIANFHHLLSKITSHLDKKEHLKIYQLLRIFLLGGNHGFDENEKVGKIHVLNSIRSVDKTYTIKETDKFATQGYEWLSEFAHPNSLGAILMFSRSNPSAGKVRFYFKPEEPEGHTTSFDGTAYMMVFEADWASRKKITERIKNEWITLDYEQMITAQ